MVVEIVFSIGARHYQIRRGIKPNIFEIYQDQTLINQSSSVRDYQAFIEQNVLKLNFRSFTQIVALGSSSFVPFMQLPAAARREIIEDLLDIRVFSVMNLLLKSRLQDTKDRMDSIVYQISLMNEKIILKQKYMKTLQEDRAKLITQQKIKAEQLEMDKIGLEKEMAVLHDQKMALYEKVAKDTETKTKLRQLDRIESGIKAKLRTANSNLSFFESNNTCPTCLQEINEGFRKEKVTAARQDSTELAAALEDLRSEYTKLSNHLALINQQTKELLSLDQAIARKQSEITHHQDTIAQLRADINTTQKDHSSLEVEKKELVTFVEQMKQNVLAKKTLIERRELLHVASDLLKDTGIKTQIIRQYIPVMNQLINKYLAAMEFFVDFQLSENFTETIKSRYRDEFSYENFSEGEKMRIDLAILLAWRAVARLKNSINTNLLILDEVFDASLDADGCEAFLKLIYELSHDTNVHIISHKGDVLADKFERNLRFEKTKNFSHMIEV